MVESIEECDDGNTENLDGCSATCQLEEVTKEAVAMISSTSTASNTASAAASSVSSLSSAGSLSGMGPSLFVLSQSAEFTKVMTLTTESFNMALESSLVSGFSISNFVFIPTTFVNFFMPKALEPKFTEPYIKKAGFKYKQSLYAQITKFIQFVVIFLVLQTIYGFFTLMKFWIKPLKQNWPETSRKTKLYNYILKG